MTKWAVLKCRTVNVIIGNNGKGNNDKGKARDCFVIYLRNQNKNHY